MPAKRLASFLINRWPSVPTFDSDPWTVFEWLDSSENGDLVTWAEAFRPGQLSASVDTGVSPPVFHWQQTANGSASGSFDLVAGRMVRVWKVPELFSQPVLVSHFDGVPDGRWVSDEYGRPLDINDLQAP